uniref:TBC1 domain family member 23 n=1 Tax=Timspurckia oligopyrenoides TaxID=708627 RepID=A0A7S1ER00_9RHOD|mmetsp:Transcript_13602/g.24393  ORF Transcript_13602/g.24393 Transcript_13602/m.24393 type:complete len:629 (+) Transcript_13602:162-2048(+)
MNSDQQQENTSSFYSNGIQNIPLICSQYHSVPLPMNVRILLYESILILPNTIIPDYSTETANEFLSAALNAEQLCNDRDQLYIDSIRTRADIEYFQNENTRAAMIRLLSLFCFREHVNYIQGMNELLAPWMILPGIQENPRRVLLLMRAFAHKFLSFLLVKKNHDAFAGLKLVFEAFTALMHYHDPQLASHFELNHVSVDLFATSWILTAFSRNLSIELTLTLWDRMVLDAESPCGLLFFCLELLMSNRNQLLNVSHVLLPETVNGLCPKTEQEVIVLYNRGCERRSKNTPLSYVNRIDSGLFSGLDLTQMHALFRHPLVAALHCVVCTADDLYRGRHQSQKLDQELIEQHEESREMPIFVLDCRTLDEYNAGHAPKSIHLKLDSMRLKTQNSILSTTTTTTVPTTGTGSRSRAFGAGNAAAGAAASSSSSAGVARTRFSADSEKQPLFKSLSFRSTTTRSSPSPADESSEEMSLESAAEVELKQVLKLIAPLESRAQLCLCGSGDVSDDTEDVAQLGNHLIHRMNVKYVSILQGGFESLSVRSKSIELSSFRENLYKSARIKRRLQRADHLPRAERLQTQVDVVFSGGGFPALGLLFERNPAFSRLRSAFSALPFDSNRDSPNEDKK